MRPFNNPGQADHAIISISGGKDSAVLMTKTVRELRALNPSMKFHFVHAVIDIDWDETLDVVRKQCEHIGVMPTMVQAVNKHGQAKGFLSILTSPRMDRKIMKQVKELRKELERIEDAHEYREAARHIEELERSARREYMVPDMGNRWCTSDLKTGPIDKFARSLKGNVLVVIGERAEESAKRAQLEAWRPDKKNTKPGRNVVKWSPILKMTEADVWAEIEQSGIPVHPCYSWGVSRASCAICIFSSDKEIAIAAERAPDIVRRYIKAEDSISTTFRHKAATKTREALKISVRDILAGQGVDVAQLLGE